MIVKWKSEFHGQGGFSLEPGEYDGTPTISNFWMDSLPKARHPDREAVAAYLTFGRTFGGHVAMPHKFSPAVANAITTLSRPVPVHLEPIEYYPKALPSGERKLVIVRDSPIPKDLLDPADQDRCYLEILRSDRASGALRRLNGLTVASNAWLHESSAGLEAWYPYVALACLFAEDLDAGTIAIPDDLDTSSRKWKDLRYLLSTARLGLEAC